MHSNATKRTSYENGKPVDHFAKIPNELINHPFLTATQKLVLIKHVSEEFKTKTKPDSQRKAAKKLGLNRNTYSNATAELAQLRLLEPAGRGGLCKQETYAVYLDRLSSVPDRNSTGSNGVPVKVRHNRQTGSTQSQLTGSNGAPVLPQLAQTRAIAEEQGIPTQEDRSADPVVTSAMDVTPSSGDFDFGNPARSAAAAKCGVTSNLKVDPQARGGMANEEPKATLAASSGLQRVAPYRPLTKAEVNDGLYLPDGTSAHDNFDDLSYDLGNIILPMVFGQPLNKGDLDLDKLVQKKGVRFCHFWARWLLRKIADEHSKGRPVASPTGLYRRAVEQGWEVSPKWPEFDEQRHTLAAREQYIKRQVEGKLKSASATFSQADLTWLAEDVRKGQRHLQELPESVRPLVRDEINRLQDIDDELDGMFSNVAKRKPDVDEQGFDFGLTSATEPTLNEEEWDEIPF